MSELYTMKPLFPGSSEIDQILRIFQILGTPSMSQWPEGYKLAEKIGYKFPICKPVNLRTIIANAS